MASLHTIFQDIADIISDKSNTESLKLKIKSDQIDWEKIVPVASSHLVIPLLYCKLKEKDLLDNLPKDLKSYLEEITNQNRDRNQTILKEVKDISLLLNTHKIDHVFLKGAAMLVTGVYRDLAERMIGDIDILVNPKQLFETQKLLRNNGYIQAEKSLTDKYFTQKHLPRLIPESKLTAIEVHRRILHRQADKILHTGLVLKNKKVCNDIFVPDVNTLYFHSILNFEINDLGFYHNYLGLRNVYDALILFKKLNSEQKTNSLKNKYISSFFAKVSCYFKIEKFLSLGLSNNFSKSIFIRKQKHECFNKVHFFVFNLVDVIALIIKRVLLFMTNPSYRKESFRKRKQILKFIKSRIQFF